MSVYESLVVNFGPNYDFLPDKPGNNINSISDDTIVCYDPDANPVFYGDDIWNFKAICPSHTTVYNFTLFLKYKAELKRIIYSRLYYSPKSRSVSSVRMTSVNYLAQWASNNKCSIENMLNDSRLYPFIASSYSNLSKRSASILLSVVRELRKVRVIHPELRIGPPDDNLGNMLQGTPLERLDDTNAQKSEQTAVIPSRIYSGLIAGFESFLSYFFEHSIRIEQLYNSIRAGCSEFNNFLQKLKNSGQWDSFLESHGLLEYASRYGLKNKKTFSAHLADIQVISRYWIHLFSGMRKNEVDTLAYGCIGDITTHGITTKIIRGFTSKLTSQGPTPTFWVTTDIIDVGIESAKYVARILSSELGFVVDDSDFPLFPSSQPKYIDGKEVSKRRFKNAPYVAAYNKNELEKRVLSKIPEAYVQEGDIRELELFDGFRNWREEFPIGQPWPLETHQCRRSLAVYLARSGRVSIGSMQVQFKHLCAAMTSYYRKGSTFAVNLLDADSDEAHRDQLIFIDSMEKEQRLAQYLNFEEKVIGNQGNLWGGEGKRIKKSHSRGEPLVIVSDRERTKERFERGEMVYKESPLGGCTKIGSCDRLSITNITPCVNCEHSVLDETSIPKIERHISNLEIERDQYDLNSLFYLHTQNEISELKGKLDKNSETNQ